MPGGFDVLPRMDGRYVDAQAIRAVERFGAMLATDTFELARRSRRSRGTFDVSQMLLQTSLGEVSPTVGALRIFRTFSASHLSLSDDQPILHRTNCDGESSRVRSIETAPGNAHPFKRMSAEASRFYRAELGQLDESTERIFQAWANSQSRKHVLAKEDDGTVVLYAEREEERQKKSHMAALRTTISNWKMSVQLPPGFLKLLSEADFLAALARSSHIEPPIAEPAIEPPSSKVRPPPPASCDMARVVVPSLSHDFDERASEMLAALVAA